MGYISLYHVTKGMANMKDLKTDDYHIMGTKKDSFL